MLKPGARRTTSKWEESNANTFLGWSTETNDVVNLNQPTGGLDTEESRYCTRNGLNEQTIEEILSFYFSSFFFFFFLSFFLSFFSFLLYCSYTFLFHPTPVLVFRVIKLKVKKRFFKDLLTKIDARFQRRRFSVGLMSNLARSDMIRCRIFSDLSV